MAMALLGAVLAQLLIGGWHGRQLARLGGLRRW
jgi:hypothetical protein